MRSRDVIVVGAGVAGLAAARALAERGLRVAVLEARQRVGGRIFSMKANGANVELGAEFVHGRTPELWALIEEAGLKTVERDGSMLRSDDGELLEDDPQDEGMFAPLETLTEDGGDDLPFSEWLAKSEVPQDARPALLNYVEGFNAADARRIGIRSLGAQQKAEDQSDGDRAWHIEGGYARLTDYLAERAKALGAQILLGHEVREIHWEAGSVRVVTAAGHEFLAQRCIVTLPLGVLQRANRGGVKLEPEPSPLAEARRLAMGHVCRFTMVFRSAWWQRAPVALTKEKLVEMSFLFTPQDVPGVWWTAHPEEGTPQLTGWVGGPRAEALRKKSADELAVAACEILAATFALPVEALRAELLSAHTHDWTDDPFAGGAYSYVPAGAMEAPQAMTIPVENTLFFAGEHTDVTGHWGTVHAALRSGLRAAAQVLGETES